MSKSAIMLPTERVIVIYNFGNLSDEQREFLIDNYSINVSVLGKGGEKWKFEETDINYAILINELKSYCVIYEER